MTQQDLLNSGKLLPVMEEFYSLQGEGFHTGEAAWFIRIGGCDVGCAWCDIKESWNAALFPPVETDKVVEKALLCPANAVIVTGGEPLLYNLDYLCEQLRNRSAVGSQQLAGLSDPDVPKSPKGELLPSLQGSVGEGSTGIHTFLETSGSQPLSGTWDWICLSPKRDWPPREEFYALSHELKMIIHEEEDFTWAETQRARMNGQGHLYLQPEWSRRVEILPKIIRYIERFPVWKLSLQTHKYIGIP